MTDMMHMQAFADAVQKSADDAGSKRLDVLITFSEILGWDSEKLVAGIMASVTRELATTVSLSPDNTYQERCEFIDMICDGAKTLLKDAQS